MLLPILERSTILQFPECAASSEYEASTQGESDSNKTKRHDNNHLWNSSAGPVGASGGEGANGQSRLYHARVR